MNDDDLRAALRSEAASHQPDREAMLDRITSTAMNPDGAAVTRPRARIAGAAAAVVALLAGGGVVNWALAGDAEPDRTVPTPAPSITVTTTAPPSAPPASKAAPTTPPAGKPSSKPPSKPPAGPARTTGAPSPLRSDGSAEPGSDTVTLRTTERLTALEVVIRVARTDGLTARGGTKQTPGASVTTTVTEEPGVLIYRFVMSSADVLEPGTYTFTARFRHPPGDRDAAADAYTATATTAGDATLDVTGGF